MTEKKLLQPLNATRQLVFRMLAKSIVGFKCDKLLPLIQAIKFMTSDPNIGKEPLKKHYGQRYQEKMIYLDTAHHAQLKIKAYYEGLKAKTILENDITNPKFKAFQKNIAETRIIDQQIYEMFYILFNQTTLRDMSIPAEAFAQEYRLYQSFELEEEEQKIREEKAKEDIEDEY